MADLGTESLRTAVIQALRDLITTETAVAREDTLEAMLAARRSGIPIKTLDVRLPDGQIVATITLVEDSDTVIVVDRPKFTAWVQKRAPEMVTTERSSLERAEEAISNFLKPTREIREFIYDVEQWTSDLAVSILFAIGVDANEKPEPRVSRSYETALLAGLMPVPRDPDDGTRDEGDPLEALEPESGEIVPGVAFVPAGDPTKIQIRYQPTSEKGRAAIAEAWRTGRLPAIEGLPRIEA